MQFGIIAQPVQFYMMKGLGLSAADIGSFLALMMLPWVIKPLYGLVSDFVPLFGYHRKSYIVLANLAAAISYGVMVFSHALPAVLICLGLVALSLAVSSAVMIGLALEQGRDNDRARDYFGIQSTYYYSANIIAAITGGLLCQHLAPPVALQAAAGLCVLPLLAVCIFTASMVREKRSKMAVQTVRTTGAVLRQALKSPQLWLVGLFFFCWNFLPCFGVPLYFFESKTLSFNQSMIGQLAAWNAAGMVAGALVYRQLVKDMSLRLQLTISVSLMALSIAGYFLLSSIGSAIGLELFRGIAGMIAILSLYALAGSTCPKGAEATIMALLLAIRNLTMDASTWVGGNLFTHLCHNNFYPLLIVALLPVALSASFILLVPCQRSSARGL